MRGGIAPGMPYPVRFRILDDDHEFTAQVDWPVLPQVGNRLNLEELSPALDPAGQEVTDVNDLVVTDVLFDGPRVVLEVERDELAQERRDHDATAEVLALVRESCSNYLRILRELAREHGDDVGVENGGEETRDKLVYLRLRRDGELPKLALLCDEVDG